MKTSQVPETFPIAGPDWRGTLQVWRGDDGKARRLNVLLPDGSEVPVGRDQIQDGEDSFVLPIREADLRKGSHTAGVMPEDGSPPGKRLTEGAGGVVLPATTQEIDIQRVPVNRVVESVPETRDDGEVMVIPVVQEETVVTRRLVLKEEIHIRRIRTGEHHGQDLPRRADRDEVTHRERPESTTARREPDRETGKRQTKLRFLRDW